jgi:predicted phosphoribosyltransferase
LALLKHVADEVVAFFEPSYYGAVGQFYDEFSPVSDDQVLELLAKR